MDEQKTLLRNDAFLGTGWSFPPVLTDTGVQLSRYEQDIRESLHVLFSTAPGERVCRYDYGCPLRRYAFEPLTTQLLVRLRNEISRAVTLYERLVRGTARTGRAAGPPHLYRGAHQQPPQHGLSLLPQRRDQYRQCIT